MLRTLKGHRYSFSGYPAGESPTELFDAMRWLDCLHACMSGVMVNRSHIEDDGVLHELVHLALGIAICTHSTLDELRDEVREIEEAALATLTRARAP